MMSVAITPPNGPISTWADQRREDPGQQGGGHGDIEMSDAGASQQKRAGGVQNPGAMSDHESLRFEQPSHAEPGGRQGSDHQSLGDPFARNDLSQAGQRNRQRQQAAKLARNSPELSGKIASWQGEKVAVKDRSGTERWAEDGDCNSEWEGEFEPPPILLRMRSAKKVVEGGQFTRGQWPDRRTRPMAGSNWMFAEFSHHLPVLQVRAGRG
jgi:hypothetical protein